MHDPSVVAFEVPFPFPVRKKWRESSRSARRWGFYRDRRTNAENLGEPTYRWWRLRGWHLRVAGREYALARFATVWHVEPGGRDMGEVCKHHRRADSMPRWRARITPWLKYIPERSTPDDPAAGRAWIVDNGWQWHIHHWRVQVHILGRLKRYLFERCIECGRRFPWGYAPVSHQWDGPRAPWFRVSRLAYHHECSALVHARRSIDQDGEIVRGLVAYLRTLTDRSEGEIVEELCGRGATWAAYHVQHRLRWLLGYEWDQDTDRMVKRVCGACGEAILPPNTAYVRYLAGERRHFHREHVPAPASLRMASVPNGEQW